MAEMNFNIIKNNLYCIHVIVPKYGDKTKPDAGLASGFKFSTSFATPILHYSQQLTANFVDAIHYALALLRTWLL